MVLCVLCVAFFTTVGCGDSIMIDIDDSGNASCEDKEILKILKDEPAIVRRGCFEHLGSVEAFYFELKNSYCNIYGRKAVFPVGEIPQQYRKDGLLLYISGNVTSCSICTLGCVDTQYFRLAPRTLYLFELKSIKIKK